MLHLLGATGTNLFSVTLFGSHGFTVVSFCGLLVASNVE